ncbi:MAG: ribosome small subunit-dependent GTPase A [Acetatifactor sp.]|nr:ribosome small subunit-dependent GTPase A [Acetatifactor sp.]
MKGKIIKGIAGFYYVQCRDAVYECKAKGVFRKDKKKPLVGDDVEIDVLDQEEHSGNITKILPRHSELIRPAVANVDQALVIFAIVKPTPNLNLLDRFLIMMRQQNIPCIICFNKIDIDEAGAGAGYEEIYRKAGYQTLSVSAGKKLYIEELKELLRGKTTTVAGPSGVGKSSLINCIQDGVVMETGGISEKIERGRHTTRHAELITIEPDTFILDTPGFSSLGLFDLEKEDLADFYGEFTPFERYCKFGGCSHISEPVCGIRDAVEEGQISQKRYENYCLLYEELKDRKKY